ncbi:hypothetical protein DT73_10015 [Mangrovibacter sp. MFB070]|nr:hypothetical protein DT73_10015 [Mangrovibacter sp. MFB070]
MTSHQAAIMAAFLYPATITPQTRHARTTTPDHQCTDSSHNHAVTTHSGGNFLLSRTPAGAQCFPRHACPLYGSVLMQLHQLIESQPTQASALTNKVNSHMQNNALWECEVEKQARGEIKAYELTSGLCQVTVNYFC